ncbi:Integrase core domain-containing protein [Arthrobacter sp. ok909]|uniref:integrase catalytic domain-containing protein n=2 Tax=Arthrobacter sp. ok909 TaxID=1761746 RepID=UPI00088A3274|nr:transposase family protein [Arthrobacter sp. ok909]SDP78669.1 Integrase core domain-containing protein [Arthrobacter sp. ok909]
MPLLRRDGEVELTDEQAGLLMRMSAATIDRKLAPERARLIPRGRSHTKPGTLLKAQIPIRTWAEWDDAVPGFVEIDLVGHEGGNSFGEFCFTLTVTDIATGWTVNRSVRNKAAKWVFEALEHVTAVFPFPIIGIDSDNGSEFINEHLLAYCHARRITFTRSRPGNKNCEDWCGWSGTGWQSRCWPFRPVVATQTRTGPRRVPFRRLVRPWGGRPIPARPTSVT